MRVRFYPPRVFFTELLTKGRIKMFKKIKRILPIMCATLLLFGSCMTVSAAEYVSEYEGFNMLDYVPQKYEDIPEYTSPDFLDDWKYYVIFTNQHGNVMCMVSNYPLYVGVKDQLSIIGLGYLNYFFNNKPIPSDYKRQTYYYTGGTWKFSTEDVVGEIYYYTWITDGTTSGIICDFNHDISTPTGDVFFYIRGLYSTTLKTLPTMIADRIRTVLTIAVFLLVSLVGLTVLSRKLPRFLRR